MDQYIHLHPIMHLIIRVILMSLDFDVIVDYKERLVLWELNKIL